MPYRLSPAAADTLRCPCDGLQLMLLRADQLEAALCEACGGVWITSEELRRLRRCIDRQSEALGLPGAAPQPAADDGPSRTCPRCSRSIVQRATRISGVTIDVCSEHGVWFDSGELQMLVAGWMSRDGAASRHASELDAWLRRNPNVPKQPRGIGAGPPSAAIASTPRAGVLDALLEAVSWLLGPPA